MLIDSSGSHFDPLIIESLAACERTINQIRERESDNIEAPSDLNEHPIKLVA